MTNKTETVTDMLVKIARAQKRGTLTERLNIECLSGSTLIVKGGFRSWSLAVDMKNQAETLAWFQKTWPAGESKPSRLSAAKRRDERRRWVYLDRCDWTVGRMLRFEYLVPHEHVRFKSYADKPGTPTWFCVDCTKKLTVTQARALGLTP